jgi:cytochrome P450
MTLLTIILTLLALPGALMFWTAQSLARNRAKAKATGLPYLERWISPINPFWLLYGSSFVRFCERLGIASENLSRIYSFGWEANTRADVHEYVSSDVILVVHPGGLQLCVANAGVIYDILQRRTDFRRNMEEMAILNVYGKNLSTTDDQEWQRHRKMTSVTFTEKNNQLVWKQSLIQAKGMLSDLLATNYNRLFTRLSGLIDYWTKRSQQPIRSSSEDTKVLTLNVLAAALFNKVYPFEGHAEESGNRHVDDKSYLYRSSLSTILNSVIQIFILGEEGLKAWWTPKSWKGAAEAVGTFRSYILGLMSEEKDYLKQGNMDHQHLVARLVRARESEQGSGGDGLHQPVDAGPTSKKVNMTEEEMISNIFVYAFAGNDTTAIALTSLIAHLSANPQTQDWIAEELRHYLPNPDSESWAYDNFKCLKRCGAVIVSDVLFTHYVFKLFIHFQNTGDPIHSPGIHNNTSACRPTQVTVRLRMRFWPRIFPIISCHGPGASVSVLANASLKSNLLLCWPLCSGIGEWKLYLKDERL